MTSHVTRAAGALLVAIGASACLPPIVEPAPSRGEVREVELAVRIAADAPPAAANDAPDVQGLLPTGMPDSVVLFDVGLVGLQDGVSGDVLVDVSGLGAMTILVYGHPGTSVILERVVDPEGAVVVDDVPPADLAPEYLAFARGFPAQVFSQNRVLASSESGSFLVPNTPAVRPLDGTWTLRVSAWRVDLTTTPPTRTPVDRPLHVAILARGVDTGRGRLDLNLHFAGAQLAAVDAERDAFVAGALDVVREAYGAVGIAIGEVRYQDAPRGFDLVELTPGSCDPGDLLELASSLRGSTGPPGADVFFIDGFVCFLTAGVDIGGGIAGLSAGLPGPPWVRGSPHSGVAVSTSFADDDAAKVGVVMAHEIAHFLGLYHTREQTFFNAPPIFDVIDDTQDGEEADDNLMFFAASDDVSLSAGQGAVLRSSPLVVAVEP